jgi:uncharacterized protein (TIGR02677 family)
MDVDGDVRWGGDPVAGDPVGAGPGGGGDAGDAGDASFTGAGGEEFDRLEGFTYLTVPDRTVYVGIMRLFVSSLLVDFSAPEVAARLAEQGLEIDADAVADRLRRLMQWGNLLHSSHTVRASSIREYRQARQRFQMSRLGERIQRSVDEVLGAADSAREVSRQMLALVARGLAELADLLEQPGGPDVADAGERIGTLFVQFAEFADSVRDFYAYLGTVLSRYDLDSADYTGFKELLLDYVESITQEVSMLAPKIAADLRRCEPRLPALLTALDTADPGLSGLADIAPGTRIRRGPGRDLADWDALRGWFKSEDGSPSEVDQLRSATLRALQSLLANAKRMIRASGGEVSRRRDLLRLARWFDEADHDQAEDLFAAAFGLYGARHLSYALSPDVPVPTSASWWHGPDVGVPVSLRERGDRAPRGRTAGAEDHTEQKERLVRQAAEAARARQAAAAELRAAGSRLDGVRLSSAALSLLLELLASALGAASTHRHDAGTVGEQGAAVTFSGARAAAKDVDLALTVTHTAGHRLTLRSPDGDLQVEDLRLHVGAAAEPAPPGALYHPAAASHPAAAVR